MTVKAVTETIEYCRAAIGTSKESGHGAERRWREIDVSYEIVAPIIGALGWNINDPMECHLEYRRAKGRADYVIFDASGDTATGADAAPLIIIEVKRPGSCLSGATAQLESYIAATPPMLKGTGVLTDGTVWHFYDVVEPGRLAAKPTDTLDITEGNARDVAKVLNRWLSKNGKASAVPGRDAVLMLNGFLRGLWVGIVAMAVWALVGGLTGWDWMSSFNIIWVFVVSGLVSGLQKVVNDSNQRSP